ncbi:MAG: hypothetical protein IPJ65_26845 [Archangiaceae bacterium]|nr:hypothetical protein [Archangiaceae bacterium]
MPSTASTLPVKSPYCVEAREAERHQAVGRARVPRRHRGAERGRAAPPRSSGQFTTAPGESVPSGYTSSLPALGAMLAVAYGAPSTT